MAFAKNRILVTTVAASLLLAIAKMASSAVTFVGPISPSAPPPGGVSTATLEVGFGSNPDTVDPRATVIVDGGSTLLFDEAYVGSDEGFFGRLLVSGDGSLIGDGTRFTVDESGSSSEPALQIGREGDGYLLVEGGAWVDVSNSAGDLSIGDQDTGVGRAVIKDAFSLVSVGQNIVVGNEGYGRLDIQSGALVRTEDETSAGVTIGGAVGGVGEVYVDGAGTRLRSADDLTVGAVGAGLLVISNQAVVDADNSSSPTATIGAAGRVTLDGGTLLVDSLAVTGVLGGSGFVRGSGAGVTTINAAGRVDVGSGQLLTLDDSVSNQGSINVSGGEIELLGAFTNNAQGVQPAPGRITLESGRVRLTQALTNSGVIAATEGASDVHGAVTNDATGSVIVARDAVLTFHDAFTASGGTVDVLAGGNALFLADATFQAAATLTIGLDTDPLSAGGAPIDVGGVASLGGELLVTTPADYVAAPGDTFTLLQSAGGITGAFDTTTLPTLPGNLEFGLLSTPGELSLEVRIATVATLDGDFNNDGVVSAADYTAWRDGLVPTTQQNFDLWAANLGATAASLSTSEAIPEPTAWVIALIAAGTAAASRRVG